MLVNTWFRQRRRATGLDGGNMAARERGDGTVGKALEVLDRVAAYDRPVRFSELLQDSAYPKATLYRLLQTLCSQGMVGYNSDTQQYSLGVRLVRLAHAAWQQSSLAPIARPHIDQLSAQVAETVHLAQLDNAHVLYVDKRSADTPVEMFSQAGKVGPAYCTGVGKAMLAFLPDTRIDTVLKQQSYHRFTPKTLGCEDELRQDLLRIRDRGFAFDDEEHEQNIICVAHPILSPRGRVLGAISVTSTTGRSSLDTLSDFVPMIRSTAEKIADEASAWGFPETAPGA